MYYCRLNVDSQIAQCLLACKAVKGSPSRLFALWFADADAQQNQEALKAEINRPASKGFSGTSSGDEDEDECLICWSKDVPMADFTCEHARICLPCFQKDLACQLGFNGVTMKREARPAMPLPYHCIIIGCPGLAEEASMRVVLDKSGNEALRAAVNDSLVYGSTHQILREATTRGNLRPRKCPCCATLMQPGKQNKNGIELTCSKGTKFCALCLQAPHEPVPCAFLTQGSPIEYSLTRILDTIQTCRGSVDAVRHEQVLIQSENEEDTRAGTVFEEEFLTMRGVRYQDLQQQFEQLLEVRDIDVAASANVVVQALRELDEMVVVQSQAQWPEW